MYNIGVYLRTPSLEAHICIYRHKLSVGIVPGGGAAQDGLSYSSVCESVGVDR